MTPYPANDLQSVNSGQFYVDNDQLWSQPWDGCKQGCSFRERGNYFKGTTFGEQPAKPLREYPVIVDENGSYHAAGTGISKTKTVPVASDDTEYVPPRERTRASILINPCPDGKSCNWNPFP